MSVWGETQEANTVTFTQIRRPDRRHAKRLVISVPAHIRSLGPRRRHREEVRHTLNFNRSGLHFITRLEHYYRGMRVLVTFPYPTVAPVKKEFLGRVVRVENFTRHWRKISVQFIF